MPTRIVIEPPNDKQAAFFMATSRFIAYGGARGGGKSWAVRKKAMLLGINYPGIRMLLLRRTFPELRENHILPLMGELRGIATFKEADKAFTFANGSRLKLGYCDNESDVRQYQGQEYDIIFIDEATQFTEFQFSTMTACIRGANDFPKRMYLTCNPGGVGHDWVKRLFVDKQYKRDERPEDYTFVQATVYDNKQLMDKDPDYIIMLQNLPEDLRAAWLEGRWDVFVGQYFKMWSPDVHVMEPFAISPEWRKYITLDYGLDMLACYWIAVDTMGRAYVYKELYKSGLIISEAAEEIKRLNTEGVRLIFAPPDLWNRRQDTGKSVADIFAQHGLYLDKADNRRIQGWYDLAEWLKVYNDEQGAPCANLRVFRNCTNLIRTLPQLQFNDKEPNDVASEPHELTHAPDAIRYFVAGRPMPTAIIKEPSPFEPEEDDLNSFLNYGG